MMNELLKELVPVVASETQRASKQYGDKYASAHEAESVLREEVNELAQDAIFCSHEMEQITANLHFKNDLNGDTESDTTISNLKSWALDAAAEAIQVAAVCEKISRGFEK